VEALPSVAMISLATELCCCNYRRRAAETKKNGNLPPLRMRGYNSPGESPGALEFLIKVRDRGGLKLGLMFPRGVVSSGFLQGNYVRQSPLRLARKSRQKCHQMRFGNELNGFGNTEMH